MRDNSQPKQRHAVTQVIENHLLKLQHDTGISLKTFVAGVREYYVDAVLPASQFIEWSHFSDINTRMTRDAEKFKRWLEIDSSVHFPLNALEAVIAAFPADRRLMLQVELAKRQGLTVCLAPGDAANDIATLGNIAKAHGETMISLSAIFADGVVDEQDRPYAYDAIAAIEQTIAVLLAMQTLIKVKALGES